MMTLYCMIACFYTVQSFTFPCLRAPRTDSILSGKVGDGNCRYSGNIALHMQTASSIVLPVEAIPITDMAAVLSGSILLTIYHARLYIRDRKGERSWRTSQAKTREIWSKYVRETESWLYAIQTLRNAITAQTFLATSVLSLLTVISGRLWELSRQMPSGPMRRTVVTQFVVVAASLLSSAYNFLQSARLMTHAGFMFPVNSGSTEVDRIMRKSENSQWLGLRCLYLSASFLGWIVGGPRIFFLASVLLTYFFQSTDQAPKSLPHESTELL